MLLVTSTGLEAKLGERAYQCHLYTGMWNVFPTLPNDVCLHTLVIGNIKDEH